MHAFYTLCLIALIGLPLTVGIIGNIIILCNRRKETDT